MFVLPSGLERLGARFGHRVSSVLSPDDRSAWTSLPTVARGYVGAIIVVGVGLFIAFFPRSFPYPFAFLALLVVACLTSLWKVKLLLSPTSDSTLSVSYAADLMALLLLGPEQAMVIAVAGAWTQCTFKVRQRYPAHRTIFSMAAEAITIQVTWLAYASLGGVLRPLDYSILPKPLVGAIAAYFLVNTGLVAGAIALAGRERVWKVWHQNFLWSGPSFMVAGAAGALAGVVIERGELWLALLMLAPVYLTYRTYHIFLGRIEDQAIHVDETRKLHAEAVEALELARRAERALADEKERLSVTLRSIGDGVISTDLEGRVLLMNNAAESLTGWMQAEALGQRIGTVFRSFDRETRERSDALGDLRRSLHKPTASRCTVLAARDLSERPIEETAAPLQDTTGRTIGMVLAFRDISDALKMQAERARADKLASLGLLAGGIAHDFNNILMAIMGNISMARVTAADSAALRPLDDAEQACVRARQLTWQLMTFSKGGAPVKKPLTLARVLKESARLGLHGSNIRATFDIGPDLWVVHADEGQLVQVFNNILINAQQAMPRGGTIHLRAENVIEEKSRWEYGLRVETGPYVRVSITDQGIGIPEPNLGSIFDPYFTTKQKGSGLGLATSHSIVKNHGGYLSVQSTLDRGTTVHVNLPASLDHELAALDHQMKDSGEAQRDADSGRVLVMDDEPSIRKLVVNMLEFLGYEPEAVSNGAAAIDRYQRALAKGRRFDVVLLDLVVPDGMGGKETIERLRVIDRSVNAILASGYVQDTFAELQELGFKAVIDKPYTLAELGNTLRSVISAQTSRPR